LEELKHIMSISEIDRATERIPLSFNQQFLTLFDRGEEEGPFGPKYTIVCGWRLTGQVDPGPLQEALDDVVERHESLRTKIVREGDGGYQEVCPPSPVPLDVRDYTAIAPEERDLQAERLLIEVESGSYSLAELPLLRAFLGRFAADDAVLVLVAHHTAVDEWSLRLIMRDLAVRYAIRADHLVPDLPPVPQYQQYARWQHMTATDAAGERSRAYWRQKLDGARIYVLPTDHPRSAGLPKGTAWYRFTIDEDLNAEVSALSRSVRCSPFMILLGAYGVLLNSWTGVTDIVVPTFTSGRGQGGFQDTVGSFFNFVPLRIDLAGCADFRDVVKRVRSTCLEAYSRDIPFAQIMGEAPELMAPAAADDMAVWAFQVFRSPEAERQTVAGLEYAEIRERQLSQPSGGDVPDGAMWHLDIAPTGVINGTVAYNTNLYDESTVSELAARFREVLRRVIAAPDGPLSE